MPDRLKYHPELDGKCPPCFEPDVWRIHVHFEKSVPLDRPSGYCTECTASYKHKMLEEGRCWHPDVVFVEDENGAVVGVREEKELYTPK